MFMLIDLARERHLQCLYHRCDSFENGAFWTEFTVRACFLCKVKKPLQDVCLSSVGRNCAPVHTHSTLS
jgi:hypothetical protein